MKSIPGYTLAPRPKIRTLDDLLFAVLAWVWIGIIAAAEVVLPTPKEQD